MSVRAPPALNSSRSKDDTDTPTKELPQNSATPARRRNSFVGPPSIVPRTNKSAELRAAKKELEAAAAAAKKGPRKSAVRPVASKAPPSSFKTPAVAS